MYALVGPYVDFRTYGNGYLKGNGDNSIHSLNVSTGFQGGIGLEFLKHYQIECNYQLGLLPDYKGGSLSGKNSAIMVTLGLAF